MNTLRQVQADAQSWLLVRRTIEVAVMLLAATFEVCGDALIRSGLKGRGWLLCGIGVATLGAYGVVVNLLKLDFSKLLATYVGFFAVVSVVFGRLVFSESVPSSTWAGLAIILIGSAVIQLGVSP